MKYDMNVLEAWDVDIRCPFPHVYNQCQGPWWMHCRKDDDAGYVISIGDALKSLADRIVELEDHKYDETL